MPVPHPQPRSLTDEAQNVLWLIHADGPDLSIADQIAERYTPTTQGQADDLYIDHPSYRVWISRMSTEDGEPFNDAVTVEINDNGRWVDALRLNGAVTPAELDEHDVLAPQEA